MSAAPTVAPGPVTTLMVPGGKNGSMTRRLSMNASGASVGGLTTTVLPAIRIGPSAR
jgi:hypothetical protein